MHKIFFRTRHLSILFWVLKLFENAGVAKLQRNPMSYLLLVFEHAVILPVCAAGMRGKK